MCATGNAGFNDNAASRSDKSYFVVDSSIASTASSFVNTLTEDVGRARISALVIGIECSDDDHINQHLTMRVFPRYCDSPARFFHSIRPSAFLLLCSLQRTLIRHRNP